MSDFNTTISFDVFSVSLSFVDEGTFVIVKQYVDEQLDSKQDTLIAGDNISIVGNVISSTGSESSVSATGAPLYLSNEDSDVLGYKKIKSSPDTDETIQTITLTTTEQLIRTYLFDLPIGVTTIAAGNWLGSVIGKISNAAGTSKLRVEAFLRHINGTETTLFSKESADINNTDYATISMDFAGDVYSCLVTDRLGFRVYGITSGGNRTLTTKIGDGNLSYFSTPLSIRHDQTRDKNGNPDFLHATQAQHDRWTNNYTYKIEDTSVSTWVVSSAYAGYGYQAQINVANLTESDIVSVVFAGADVISGNYYPTIEQYDGYILVFAKVNTTIIIPTIEITKIDL
jgi:hypothetical protein